MDSRRTPNQLKAGGAYPKSAGSTSKFARPRSNRKQDANSTILLGWSNHNASIMGSVRNLNQTVRHNLDITISGPSNPRIKSNINAPVNDIELEYDLAYNEYLQAIMKHQIVKRTIEQHKEKLNDQILIQGEQLHKLESTFNDLSNKIKNLKQQSEIVEVLSNVKNGMDNIEILCKKYSTFDRLQQLNNILTKESNLVSIRNIKPISSQEEYDQFMSTLHSIEVTIQKILNSGRNFEEVNKLATSIKEFHELQDRIREATKKVCVLRKRAAANFIKHGSDMFAEMGGYF